MKKLLSVIMIAVLTLALCVPALAENEPDRFNTDVYLVNNEPTIENDEWGVPYNVWTPKTDAIVIGQPVTVVLSYNVAESVDDIDATLLGSIEYLVSFTGIEGIELVEAVGCPTKMNCDYDLGVCVPVWGEYSNVEIENDVLRVMAELDSDVQVIVRGTATAETLGATADVTIGQYTFPAQFNISNSVADVEKRADGFYNIHRSDFTLVQKRDLALVNNAMGGCDMYAAINGHYYSVLVENAAIVGFVPVEFDEEDSFFYEVGDPIDSSDELYATLTNIVDEYKDFFGFGYDISSVDDSMFLANAEDIVAFSSDFVLEVSEAPVETTAPVESENPADPSNPIPGTGSVALVGVGIAALVSGAGIALSRSKEN